MFVFTNLALSKQMHAQSQQQKQEKGVTYVQL